jgi:hypothetical protein
MCYHDKYEPMAPFFYASSLQSFAVIKMTEATEDQKGLSVKELGNSPRLLIERQEFPTEYLVCQLGGRTETMHLKVVTATGLQGFAAGRTRKQLNEEVSQVLCGENKHFCIRQPEKSL